jgi:hypothetical protein
LTPVPAPQAVIQLLQALEAVSRMGRVFFDAAVQESAITFVPGQAALAGGALSVTNFRGGSVGFAIFVTGAKLCLAMVEVRPVYGEGRYRAYEKSNCNPLATGISPVSHVPVLVSALGRQAQARGRKRSVKSGFFVVYIGAPARITQA